MLLIARPFTVENGLFESFVVITVAAVYNFIQQLKRDSSEIFQKVPLFDILSDCRRINNNQGNME